MIDQLEICDIIVLNKIDLVTKKQLKVVKANLKALNPEAEVIPTNFSIVDLKNVLSVKRFNLEKAEKDSKWIL
jgi:G3E family GTPase